MWDLVSRPRIEPLPPTLKYTVVTTGPPSFFFKKKGSPSGSRSAFLFDRERTVREDSREISSVSLLMGYNSRHNTLLDRLVSQSLLLTWNGY